VRRHLVTVKRKWCNGCQTRRPHAELWYAGLAGTCIFWDAETGMCGCSTFSQAEPKYPAEPCHGGYRQAWTCCKCMTTKQSLEPGWTLCDDYGRIPVKSRPGPESMP